STARTGALQVNTFHTTFSKKTVILLNLECNAVAHAQQLQEEAIRIAAYFADRFIREKVPVAFYTNGKDLIMDEPFRIDAGSDRTHIRSIEIALARLDTAKRPVSFTELLDKQVRPEDGAVEYLLISNYRKKDLCDKYAELKKQGYSMRLLVPEFSYNSLEPALCDDQSVMKWTVQNDY
ncbi:MAG TPA: DUF58 domain-containing protein, partial [Lachnospiraceae bacterium]|nr:DUF58 domain-containing protein [Lachnospiraceae bacterium]